ncbi:MAG: hypothetical protein ACREV8_14665, partial [Gammaproteobacteria bacterium]
MANREAEASPGTRVTLRFPISAAIKIQANALADAEVEQLLDEQQQHRARCGCETASPAPSIPTTRTTPSRSPKTRTTPTRPRRTCDACGPNRLPHVRAPLGRNALRKAVLR